MDIQVDTPFLLHPQLDRITPPDVLRPYNIPRKPAPLQNGRFTPMPVEKVVSGKPNSLQNGYFTPLPVERKPAVDPSVIRNAVFNSELDKMNQARDEFANKVLSDTAKLFNNRGNLVSKGSDVVPENETQPVAKSKAEQAKLNNADWVAKYKERAKNITPRVDPISMQSQMAAALRDPVYGQATATGLAAGEGMLNSWIAGLNSRARKDEGELANERWIKQMQDADEDRALRRQELAESKREIVDAVPYQIDAFKEKMITSNPEYKAMYDILSKPYNAENAFDAAQHRAKQVAAIQSLNAAQQSMPSKITDIPARSEIVESEGLMDYPRRMLNAIPGVRRATLSKNERARANLIPAMKKEGVSQFLTITPEQLRLESARSNREGLSGLAGQQNKIAELIERISALNPGSIVKQSAGGDVIVVATPNNGAVTITPGNFDKISAQYEIGTK